MKPRPVNLDNVLSIVLSLLLAFVIWLATSKSARPIETLPVSADGGVSVALRNPPPGYAPTIAGDDRVVVVMRGMDSGLDRIGPTDLSAFVDLRGAKPEPGGAAVGFDVQVDCARCRRLGVVVEEVRPTRINIRYDRIISDDRPVMVELDGGSNGGLRIIRAESDPETVTVSGASLELQRADSVVARIEEPQSPSVGTPLTISAPVFAVDAAGTVLENVTIEPPAVSVRVVFGQRGVPLPVLVRTTSQPPNGFFLAGMEHEPHEVRVLGARDALEPLISQGYVQATEIDVSDFATDQVLSVPLELPDRVTVDGLPDSAITVALTVRALPGSLPLDVPVEVIGRDLPEDYTVAPEIVRVLLSGPQPVLDALEPGAVRALVDLSGRREARFRVAVEVRAPRTLEVLSVTPDSAEVVSGMSEPESARPASPFGPHSRAGSDRFAGG